MKQNPILVANDDGYGIQGVELAVEAVRDLAPVVVVVPSINQSASSHRITLRSDMTVRRMKSRSDSVKVYAVDGSPADCVRVGIFGILKTWPRMVISGVNHGANLGQDVVYSGTVAAAREGAMLNIPSIAFSVCSRSFVDPCGIRRVVRELAEWLLKHPGTEHIFYNINMPLKMRIRGNRYAFTSLGKRIYATHFVRKKLKDDRWNYRLKEDISGVSRRGTDINAVSRGIVSVTPVSIDYNDDAVLARLRKGKKIA